MYEDTNRFNFLLRSKINCWHVKITISADVLMPNTSHKVHKSNIILNDILIYFISLEKLLFFGFSMWIISFELNSI